MAAHGPAACLRIRMAAALWRALAFTLGLAIVLAGMPAPSTAQRPPEGMPPLPGETQPIEGQPVVDVRVSGLRNVSIRQITPHIMTKVGRSFHAETVEEDVRRLHRTGLFASVDTLYRPTEAGLIVVFRFVERPTLEYVKYVGRSGISEKALNKQAELKAGDAADPYAVEEARRRIEEFYHQKGFSKASVKIFEGDRTGDHGAVFVVSEGEKQKVWKVEFIGNTPSIVTNARLKTQIQSKPPLFFIFKGEVDRDKIDGDVDRLTDYYRSLGFFKAVIGRELLWDAKQKWLTLRFVINEGPRYRLRNVSFIGNTKFDTDYLAAKLKLTGGDYFDQSKMNADVSAVQDEYGTVGYIYANVDAEPRFLEEPGQLDLVYNVTEGDRYRVGKITVHVEGENPHTKINTVLNRLSLHPGEIVNAEEIRKSKRRLVASGLFLTTGPPGTEPQITFEQPKIGDDETEYARRSPQSSPGGNFRGQSPDPPRGLWSNPPAPQPSNPANATAANRRSGGATFRMQSPIPGYHAWGSDPAIPNATGDASPIGTAAGEPRVVQMQYQGQTLPSEFPTTTTYPRYTSPGGTAPGGYGGTNTYNPPQNYPSTPNDSQPNYSTTPNNSAAPNYTNTQPPTSGTFGSAPYGSTAPAFGAPNGASAPYDSTAPIFSSQPGASTAPGYMPGIDATNSSSPIYPDGGYNFLRDDVPTHDQDFAITVNETQTGRLMFGVGVNSSAGVFGNIVLEEQNFDWRRPPRSWSEIVDGTAFRGAGQTLRIEAVPGNQVQRYSINFREPYLWDSPINFGVSGYFYNRYFRDWSEERLGSRMSFGYQFTPDLSGTVALRGEKVNLNSPRVPTPPELTAALGDSDLYSISVQMAHDTRDNAFLATEGHLISAGFEQVFGRFDYPRVTLEGRQHFLVRERPDGSGRHVLSIGSELGITGSHTPIFENFFAGGYSTIRGFDFRGASPRKLNVAVGGEFQWLNSVEYLYPITADDMLRGVVFCDFGTVEESVALHGKNFRVAPGFGLRITVPAMGPAPIALDLAFPIARADGDQINNFTFFVGFQR